MAWNPIQANFDGTIGSLMQSAQRGVSDVGHVAGQYLDRVTAEDREKQRQKERGEDVLFRQHQADRAQANADRVFSLQGLAEQRAAEEQAQKMATAEAQARASEYLNAARQNVVTPQQADAILAAYNKNSRADVLGMQAKALQQYNTSPTMQKQFLGNVNVDQGPMERTVKTIDPTTGQVVDKILSVNPDMAQAQARKDMILSGLDTTIARDKDLAEKQREFTMNYNMNRAQLGESARHNKAMENAANQKAAGQVQPIKMSKILPDGRIQEIMAYTPDQVRDAQASNFMLGTIGGSYTPKETSNKSKESTDKSVYGLSQAKLLSDKWGRYDAPKILSMAETLRKANPKMSADTALGIVEDVASSGWTDAVSVYDVNERAADLGYTGKLLKK